MIQIHRLEGFYWVARVGGYAKAARAFPYPITQPAVHQQVKKLEGDLGLELFERVGKDKMQLTAAGQRLYRFITPFFEGLPMLVRSMKSGEYGGVLKIHAAPMFLHYLMPAWLKRLHRLKPDIHVQLQEVMTPDLARLRTGDADLLVDYLPSIPDDIATMVVGRLRAYLVFPASHKLAKRKKVELAEFADERFVSYMPGTLPHEMQIHALTKYGVPPREIVSATSADSILAFVESEIGFSVLPWLDGHELNHPGIVSRALDWPDSVFEVVAAWRKDNPENPLLDAALETAPKA
jgi:DNA-binding transcriptional LysR family regulator